MDTLAQSLCASPELFPHTWVVDKDTVSLIALRESDYRAASFLDARILKPGTASQTIRWSQLAPATAALPEACAFIFHIGHAGSTLVSRLMGAHAGVFALREPLALRTLAQSRFEHTPQSWDANGSDDRLSTFLKLFSRTFRGGQRALVKATSFVCEIAPEILARPYSPKAIFMFVPAEVYLATILGGPNSRQEARMLAPSRLKRLQKRLGEQIAMPVSEGEIIAMNWACEMIALRAAQAGDRIHWLDFDNVLSDPHTSLAACFRHIGIEAAAEDVAAIVAGPDMHRYSKAQEYEYDARLRRDVLAQAHAQSGNEIKRGLAWLERAGKEFPTIGEAAETK
jgi:hypothetical protein